MITIVHLPIEPLEDRYSQDWLEWYDLESRKTKEYKELFLLGNYKYDKIECGAFLDVCKTMVFKNSQMASVLTWFKEQPKQINWSKVVFFFHDLWHPGVTDLLYIRNGLHLPFKIVGILHAGTYDPYDFLARNGMKHWGSRVEQGWFEGVDKIFVATHFHKKLLYETQAVFRLEKIAVTGLPIYPRKYCFDETKQIKDLDVVFPHRLDIEKQPFFFDKVAAHFKDNTFEKTMELNLTKEQYYARLSRYKIAFSSALQETWGIAMQECVFAGCIPLVPDRLSYSEMYPVDFKYSSFEHSLEMVDKFIKEYKTKKTRSVWKDLYNSLEKSGREAIQKQKEEIFQLCQ
ncbi:MAG TPA: hypothetical protein PLI14_06550 [Bacilli bacterium]|jgi:hypothetical protein|nr:hypothetical protein [Bacilli bacterium]